VTHKYADDMVDAIFTSMDEYSRGRLTDDATGGSVTSPLKLALYLSVAIKLENPKSPIRPVAPSSNTRPLDYHSQICHRLS